MVLRSHIYILLLPFVGLGTFILLTHTITNLRCPHPSRRMEPRRAVLRLDNNTEIRLSWFSSPRSLLPMIA